MKRNGMQKEWKKIKKCLRILSIIRLILSIAEILDVDDLLLQKAQKVKMQKNIKFTNCDKK
jgi:hypothetical protein